MIVSNNYLIILKKYLFMARNRNKRDELSKKTIPFHE